MLNAEDILASEQSLIDDVTLSRFLTKDSRRSRANLHFVPSSSEQVEIGRGSMSIRSAVVQFNSIENIKITGVLIPILHNSIE